MRVNKALISVRKTEAPKRHRGNMQRYPKVYHHFGRHARWWAGSPGHAQSLGGGLGPRDMRSHPWRWARPGDTRGHGHALGPWDTCRRPRWWAGSPGHAQSLVGWAGSPGTCAIMGSSELGSRELAACNCRGCGAASTARIKPSGLGIGKARV